MWFSLPAPTPTATPTPTPTNTPVSICVGDCNGDGTVAVNEIITMVNMALGSQTQLAACPNGIPLTVTDVSQIDIAVIIQAVNSALNGCSLV